VWAIYADVADYSEWKTGRCFTGIVFATIGFALKSGLALGSSSFLWIMVVFFPVRSQGGGNHPDPPRIPCVQQSGGGTSVCRLHGVAYGLQAG